MKEVIILEVSGTKSQLIQDFLKQKKVDYRILVENQLEVGGDLTKQRGKRTQKKDIFANYGQAIKDKQREKELKLWDNADLDEELNKDGKWWN
jgi:hypothetical protein